MVFPDPISGKVLVIGKSVHPRAFLAVVRSLGRRGLDVSAAVQTDDDGAGLASRYVRRVHRLDAFETDPARWLNRIRDIVVTERIEAVIPIDDTGVIPLQENRRHLEDIESRFYLLGDRAYAATFDKRETRRLATSLGIPIAEGILAPTAGAAAAFGEESGFPVVVKPPRSLTAADLHSKQSVRTFRDATALREAIDTMTMPVIVEQFFTGVGMGIEFLARDGDLLYVFQHDRVHERLGGGDSTYRRSSEPRAELVDATRRFVDAVGYTGVGMAEFRVDDATGSFILVEVNGRFWGSLPLAISAGADFPTYLYEMLWRGRTTFNAPYRRDLYQRNEPRDTVWFFRNFRADKNDPLLTTLPLTDVVSETLHLATGDERWDTLVADDPLPAVREISLAARLVWRRAIKNPFRGAAARSNRHRRRRMQSFRRRVEQRPEVLFLCKGNICRSPFAARRAAQLWPADVAITEAGTYPVPDRRSPEVARLAAAGMHVDLESHRSTVVTRPLVDRAGVIIVFDWRNLDEITTRWPHIRKKVFLLGELTPGRTTIIDPFGKPARVCDEVYRQIEASLTHIAEQAMPLPHQR